MLTAHFPNFCTSFNNWGFIFPTHANYGHFKFNCMVDLEQSFESELNQTLQKVSLPGEKEQWNSSTADGLI